MDIDLVKVEEKFKEFLNDKDSYKHFVSKLAFLQMTHENYKRKHDKFVSNKIDLTMEQALEVCCKLIVVSEMVRKEIENPTEK
jgi:hypothetical protein